MDRARSLSGDPANLGTAVHAVLERWVTEDHYRMSTAGSPHAVVTKLWEDEYRKLFDDDRRYAEGLKMCLDWVARQNWNDREVLMAESKRTVELPTSAGKIPFNFVWDRCDRRANGDIEVVDYKTFARPIQPGDLSKKIQARAYSMAARIAYPDAERIWVTFDLLRWDAVGVVFTRDDDATTWRYLRAVAERILADDGTAETLNPDCRYCVRRFACNSLTSHVAAGGPLSITDGRVAADLRLKLDSAQKALESMVTELDAIILEHCETEGVTGFTTDSTFVKITASRRRHIDTKQVARVLGPTLVADHSKLSITELDKLLKGTELTPEQKSQVKQLITQQYGEPSVKTEPFVAF